MRSISVITAAIIAVGGAAQAQNYATYDEPTPNGFSTSISSGERVQRSYSVIPEAASTSQIEPSYDAPVYEAYEPAAFDETAYKTATEPLPLTDAIIPADPLPVYVPLPAIPVQPETGTQAVSVPEPAALDNDFSQPLGSPQTFARAEPVTLDGDVGFAAETETSRLLLALEDTYAKRVAALKAKNLERRKALLDGFEKDAADPEKVIGLAARMRAALSEADAAHQAMLDVEESQYTAAMLQVLDAAPARTN